MTHATAKMLGSITGILLVWAIMAAMFFAPWVTHIIVTIRSEQWLLLIAGAIMFPIGIIHGWGIWLGVF